MTTSAKKYTASERRILENALNILKKKGKKKYDFQLSRTRSGIKTMRKDYDL